MNSCILYDELSKEGINILNRSGTRRCVPLPTMFPFLAVINTNNNNAVVATTRQMVGHMAAIDSDNTLTVIYILWLHVAHNKLRQHHLHNSSVATLTLNTISRSVNLSAVEKRHKLTGMPSPAPYFMISSQKSQSSTQDHSEPKAKRLNKTNDKFMSTKGDPSLDRKDEVSGEIITPTKSSNLHRRSQGTKNDRKSKVLIHHSKF